MVATDVHSLTFFTECVCYVFVESVTHSKKDSSPPVVFISFQWDMQSKVCVYVH